MWAVLTFPAAPPWKGGRRHQGVSPFYIHVFGKGCKGTIFKSKYMVSHTFWSQLTTASWFHRHGKAVACEACGKAGKGQSQAAGSIDQRLHTWLQTWRLPSRSRESLQTFLCLWYPSTSNKKADERKAFSEACGRLETHETKAIVNNLHEYKAWLLRKKRNLKTGERTDPTLMALFNAILQKDNQGINLSSSSSSMKMPGEEELEKADEKPVKRLRSKQPLNDKAEDKTEVPKPAKAICFAFDTPGSQKSKSCDIVSVSSVSRVSGLNGTWRVFRRATWACKGWKGRRSKEACCSCGLQKASCCKGSNKEACKG